MSLPATVGRPDWPVIMDTVSNDSNGEPVTALVCGPASLTDETGLCVFVCVCVCVCVGPLLCLLFVNTFFSLVQNGKV
jgi:hypothetical protein